MATFSSPALLPMRKRCAKCGLEKPLTEFYRREMSTDGRQGRCKECEKQRRKERYRKIEAADGLRDLEQRVRVLELRADLHKGTKVCAKCVQVKPLEEFHRNKRLKDGRNSYCKSCTSCMTKTYRARTPGDRLALSLNTARTTSRRKGLPFTLVLEDVVSLWKAQQGLCAYSGVEMAYDGQGGPTSVSIDRVDSTKGYTKDNIVLACTQVNVMKRHLHLNDFVEWCKKVVDHQHRKRG